MEVKRRVTADRRRQVDRTAATRAALVDAARALFAEHGFADVGTERIARAAGVTRGALYHQFADKADTVRRRARGGRGGPDGAA